MWVVALVVGGPCLGLIACLVVGILFFRSKWLLTIEPPRPTTKYLFTVE